MPSDQNAMAILTVLLKLPILCERFFTHFGVLKFEPYLIKRMPLEITGLFLLTKTLPKK